MHARYADERRSRWEQQREDYPEQSSSYDESYLHHNKASMSIKKSPSLGQQHAQAQQRGRGVASTTAQPMRAGSVTRRMRAENATLPAGSAGMVSQYQKDQDASTGNKYRDREMRLHQSIVYNRARIKIEQQQEQEKKLMQQQHRMQQHQPTEESLRRSTPTVSMGRSAPLFITPTHSPGGSVSSSSRTSRQQDSFAQRSSTPTSVSPGGAMRYSPAQHIFQQQHEQKQQRIREQKQQKKEELEQQHQQRMWEQKLQQEKEQQRLLELKQKQEQERLDQIRERERSLALQEEQLEQRRQQKFKEKQEEDLRKRIQQEQLRRQQLSPVPTEDEGGSVLSGYSKPFDERVNSPQNSALSGFTKPFDEKQGQQQSTSPATPDRSTTSQSSSSPTLNSNGDSTSASFWKHATPPPNLSNSVAANRFKLPPPRVAEPATQGYHEPYEQSYGAEETSKTFETPPRGSHADAVPAAANESVIVHEPNTPQESLAADPLVIGVSDPSPATVDLSTSSANGPRVPDYADEEDEPVYPSQDGNDYATGTNSRRAPDIILNHDDTSREEEDDSLFGYLTEQSKQKIQQPPPPEPRKEEVRPQPSKKKKSRQYSHYPDTTDDDTSVETPKERDIGFSEGKVSGSPGSLAARAQQAWQQRQGNKQNPRRASTPDDSPSRAKPSWGEEHDDSPERGAAKVSFGAVDTVHHYPNNTPDDDHTLGTYTDESGYTKSLESEVEDMFKDIFLIGDSRDNKPGRRKKSYVPSAVPDTDDDTFASAGTEELPEEEPPQPPPLPPPPPTTDQTSSIPKSSSPAPNEVTADGEDPLLSGVWNMMESGVGAIGGALGLLNAEDDDTIMTEDTGAAPETQLSQRSSEEMSTSRGRPPRPPPPGSSAHNARAKSPPGETPARTPSLFDYVQESLMAAAGHGQSHGPKGRDPDAANRREAPGELRTESVEQDASLYQLATESARMHHRMHGHEYDESRELDITKDIQFIVADLRLPMGMVFQENQTGCWITKILPDGSAARTSVAVGDQLAAIDGVSAIHMKVDQIADVVRKKKGTFELTLLRYVGKLRPKEVSKSRPAVKDEGGSETSSKPSGKRRSSSEGRRGSAQNGRSSGSSVTRKNQPKRAPKFAEKQDDVQENLQQQQQEQQESAKGAKEKKRFGLFGRKKKE